MSAYRKKHGKVFKLFFFVLFCLAVLAGILFITNYNTIRLATGKGTIKVNTISQAEKSISDTGKFNSPTLTSSADDQSQALTCTSKDNAVVLTVTEQKNGKEVINAKVDLKKLDVSGLDKEAVLHGSPSAIMAAKALANDYIGTLIDSDDKTGIEAYLAANLLSQYRSDPTSLNIDHTFGNANLTLTGSLSTGKIDVNITQ